EIISRPVSVAIPTGMQGEIISRPVSVAIPTGMQGDIMSRPVSLTVATGQQFDPDIAAYWHFDGDWIDSSGNDNHGVSVNNSTFNSDSIKGSDSADFGLVSAHVVVPNAVSLQSERELTLSGWFKVNALTETWQNLIWKGNNPTCSVNCENREYSLSVHSSGYLQFSSTPVETGVGSITLNTAANTVTVGTWHYFSAVISTDSNRMQLYLDGNEVANSSYSTTGIRAFAEPVYIGLNSANTGSFDGLIDELAIYKRALTAEEIQNNYNQVIFATTPPSQPVLTSPPVLVAKTPVPLSGSKDANTSIWINSQKQVETDGATEWQTDLDLAYGSNLLYIQSLDTNGIASRTLIHLITLDNQPPEVYSISPADGATLQNTRPVISLLMTDEYAGTNLTATAQTCSLTDSQAQTVAGTWSAAGTQGVQFIPTSILADDTYTVTILPIDTLQNPGLFTSTFAVDTTPPSAPVVYWPVNSVGDSVTIQGTRAVDAATIRVVVDAGSVGSVSYPTDDTWQVHLTNLVEGSVTVSVTAYDAVGNDSTASVGDIGIDTTPPSAPVVTTPSTSTANTVGNTFELKGTKEADTKLVINNQEETSAYALTTWQKKVTLAEGGNIFNLKAVDDVGNASANVPITIISDTVAPYISDSVPAAGSQVAAVAEIRLLLADISTAVDYGNSMNDATVEHSATGLVSGSWLRDLNDWLVFTPSGALPEGVYTVTLHSKDILANSSTETISFTLDVSQPSVSFLTMTPDSPHRDETVEFMVTFSEPMQTGSLLIVQLRNSGLILDTVHAVTGNWFNTTTWQGKYTFTPESGDGDYVVEVSSAVDVVGNIMLDQQVGSFILDTEPAAAPQVTYPQSMSQTREPTQEMRGTKVSGTALLVNGIERMPLGLEMDWAINYALSEGDNLVRVQTKDAAGNLSTETIISVVLDTTAPLFTIDTYEPESQAATQVIAGKKEPGCVVTVGDTILYDATDLGETWQYQVTLTEGISTRITLTATDALLNVTQKTITVLYDGDPPVALGSGVLQASGEGDGSQVQLSWPTYIETNDLAYYAIYVSDTPFTTVVGLTSIGTLDRGNAVFTVTGLI
ncbi:MAG: Ig-like domain-containing protein, partial [Desulfuromonadales bacterium]|nr:Ig-like domain-containing protein [Desulfuromonadales bacterium]